ncbi:hypothetical protein P3T21_000849 [Paraburkholderia sp. GAS334]
MKRCNKTAVAYSGLRGDHMPDARLKAVRNTRASQSGAEAREAVCNANAAGEVHMTRYV